MSGIQTTVDTITLHGGQVASINLGEVGATVRNNGLVTVSYSDSETVRSAPEGTIFAAASVALSGVQFFYASSRAELVISPLFTDLDTVTEIAARIALVEASRLRSVIAEVMNAGSTPDFFVPLQQQYITNTLNGLNSRVDSIAVDGGNTGGGGGATFFLPNHIDVQHRTRGSAHGFTATGKVWEAVEGNDLYGEMGMYEAAIEIARRGAYAGCFEGGTTIASGKQARGFGTALFISEANALASYTMLSAQWNETGARGIWLASTGAQAPGTAMFVEGDFKRGLYFQYADQANLLLLSKQALAANAFFSINGLGAHVWNFTDGSSPLTLANAGSSVLALTGSLSISNDLTIADDLTVTGDSIQNGTGFFGGDLNLNANFGVAGSALIEGNLELDGTLNHDGTAAGFFGAAPVVQPAAVADATGGAIVDAEARTAINALLARLRAPGLIAT